MYQESVLITITVLFLFFSSLIDFRKLYVPNLLYIPLLCAQFIFTLNIFLTSLITFFFIFLLLFLVFSFLCFLNFLNMLGGADVKVTTLTLYSYLLQITAHMYNALEYHICICYNVLEYFLYWCIFIIINLLSSKVLNTLLFFKRNHIPLVPYLFLMYLFLSFQLFL